MAKLRQVEWDPRATPEANAAAQLPVLIAAYFDEGRTLVDQAADPEKLHRLRLISKRLRYTLELFAPAYGPELTAGLESIKRLQDVLGELNDAVATWRLLEPMRGAARMKPVLDAQAAARVVEFRKEWREVFDAPGKEQWWIAMLSKAGAGSPDAGHPQTAAGRTAPVRRSRPKPASHGSMRVRS